MVSLVFVGPGPCLFAGTTKPNATTDDDHLRGTKTPNKLSGEKNAFLCRSDRSVTSRLLHGYIRMLGRRMVFGGSRSKQLVGEAFAGSWLQQAPVERQLLAKQPFKVGPALCFPSSSFDSISFSLNPFACTVTSLTRNHTEDDFGDDKY